jgi:hypothetical protein
VPPSTDAALPWSVFGDIAVLSQASMAPAPCAEKRRVCVRRARARSCCRAESLLLRRRHLEMRSPSPRSLGLGRAARDRQTGAQAGRVNHADPGLHRVQLPRMAVLAGSSPWVEARTGRRRPVSGWVAFMPP